MKDLIIKLYKDQRGAAITIVMLITLPLLVFLMLSTPNLARYNRTVNTTLQNAVDIAVKDAAMMVDSESQAFGEPRIDYERAKERFIEDLYYNLNAYSDEGSSVTDLEYYLLIYNGDEKYTGYKDGKVSSYAYFTHDDSYITNSIQGFPVELGITEDGITDNLDITDIKVKVDRPFVLAVVKARVVPMTELNTSDTEEAAQTVTRWSLGEIRVRKVSD